MRALAFVTGLAAVTAAAVGAPVPRDPGKAPLYFPTAVGAEWVFERAGRRHTQVVTAAEVTDAGTVVTVARSAGGGPPEFYRAVAVGRDGLAQVRLGAFTLAPPLWLLRPPAGGPRVWDYRVAAQGPVSESRGTSTASGPEPVEVPAGRFRAVRVDTVSATSRPPGRKSSCWYAPDVGLVKQAYGDEVEVLVSFNRGKDCP